MAFFHIIIPAAGSGSRMGAMDGVKPTPKQYLPFAGKPLLAHSLDLFLSNNRIMSVNLALSPDDTLFESLDCSASPDFQLNSKFKLFRCGGASRAETVLNTLLALQSSVAEDDWILVHDAARPGLSNERLNLLLDSLQNDEVGGLLAMSVADTIKRADVTGRVEATISRERLWQAQTPQMFKYHILKQALMKFDGVPTDEAQAIEALGLQPKLIQGELCNLKVTYPHDLVLLESLVGYSKKE